jgi:hypothetical protein
VFQSFQWDRPPGLSSPLFLLLRLAYTNLNPAG